MSEGPVTQALNPAAVIAVESSSSPNSSLTTNYSNYNSSQQSSEASLSSNLKKNPKSATMRMSVSSHETKIHEDINNNNNNKQPPKLLHHPTDISFGPSVEEVALAAASITIADIDNNSLAIPPAPLFVMSSPDPRNNNKTNQPLPVVAQQTANASLLCTNNSTSYNPHVEIISPAKIHIGIATATATATEAHLPEKSTNLNPPNEIAGAVDNHHPVGTSSACATIIPHKALTSLPIPSSTNCKNNVGGATSNISQETTSCTQPPLEDPAPPENSNKTVHVSNLPHQALGQQVKVGGLPKQRIKPPPPTTSQSLETNDASSIQDTIMKPQHIMNMSTSSSPMLSPPISEGQKETKMKGANSTNTARTRCMSFQEGLLLAGTSFLSSTRIPHVKHEPLRNRSNSLPTSISSSTPFCNSNQSHGFTQQNKSPVKIPPLESQEKPIRIPSPLIKPSTLVVSRNDKTVLRTRSENGNNVTLITDDKHKTQPHTSIGQSSNNSSFYPSRQLQHMMTSAVVDSSSVPVVSSCGSSLQASPAVVAENPVRNMASSLSYPHDLVGQSDNNHKLLQNTRQGIPNLKNSELTPIIEESFGDSSNTTKACTELSQSLLLLSSQEHPNIDNGKTHCHTADGNVDKNCRLSDNHSSLSEGVEISSNVTATHPEVRKNTMGENPATSSSNHQSNENETQLSNQDGSCLSPRNNDESHTNSSPLPKNSFEHDDSKNSRPRLSSESFANFEFMGISFKSVISAALDDFFLHGDSASCPEQSASIIDLSSEKRPCLLQQSRMAFEKYQDEMVHDLESDSNQLDTVSQPCESLIENDQSFDSFLNQSSEADDYKGTQVSPSIHHKKLSGTPNAIPMVTSSAHVLPCRTLVSGTAADLRHRLKHEENNAMKANRVESLPFGTPLVEGTAAAQIIATSKKTSSKNLGPQCNQYGQNWKLNHHNKVVPIVNPSMDLTSALTSKAHGDTSCNGFVATNNSSIAHKDIPKDFNSGILRQSDKANTSHQRISTTNTSNLEPSFIKNDSYPSHSKPVLPCTHVTETAKSPAMNMLADIISHAPPVLSSSRQVNKTILRNNNGSTKLTSKKQRYKTSQTAMGPLTSSVQHQPCNFSNFQSVQEINPSQWNQVNLSLTQRSPEFQDHLFPKNYKFQGSKPSVSRIKPVITSFSQSSYVLSQSAAQNGICNSGSAGKVKVCNKSSSNGSSYARSSDKMSCFTIGKIRRYRSAIGGYGPWENLTCQFLEESSSRRWCGLNIDECREILLRRSGRLRVFPNFLTEEKRQSLSLGMDKFDGYARYEMGANRKNLYPDPRLCAMLSSKLDKNSYKKNGSDTSEIKPQPLSHLPEVESLANDVASIYRLPNEEWKNGVDLVVYEDQCTGNGWYPNKSNGDSFSLCIVTESQGTPLPVLIRLNKETSCLEDGDEEIELWLNEGDAYEMDGCVKAGYEHCLPKQKLDGMKRSLIFLRHGNNDCEDAHSVGDRRSVKMKGTKGTNRSQNVHFGHPKRDIIEGKAFYSKEFLFETGAHLLDQRGLNGNLRDGCDCLLLSKINPSLREEDGLCWLLYTTSRSQGGGALCKSFLRKKPVRIFRSSELKNAYAPQTKEEGRSSYRYDGLYSVRVMWDHEGNETNDHPPVGTSLHTFLMTRHPKKPLDGIIEDGIDYNVTGVQELWNEIQKSQGIKFPRKFEIPQPPVILPSISKCKHNNTVTSSSQNKFSAKSLAKSPSHLKSNYNSLKIKPCGKNGSDYESSSTSSSNSEDDIDSDSSSGSDSVSVMNDAEGSSSDGDTSDEESVETSDGTLEVSNGKEKMVTDSDCSNGRPKRASATAARNFLQEVMHNRFGDIHKEKKSPTQRSLEGKGSSTESTPKKKSKQESNHSSGSSESFSHSPLQTNSDDTRGKLESEKSLSNGNSSEHENLSKSEQVAADVEVNPNGQTDLINAKQVNQPSEEISGMKASTQNQNAENITVNESDGESESYGVDPTSITIGSRVNVEYRDILYKATVRKSRIKKGKHDFLIHYDGNKKSNVHWISSSKIYEVLTDESQTKKKSTLQNSSKKSKNTKHLKKENDSISEVNTVSRFVKGDQVYVDYKKILYLATVKDMKFSNKSYDYLMHYDGYKKNSDRWVHDSKLHAITASSTRRFNKLRSEKGDLLSGNIEFSDEEEAVSSSSSKRKTDKFTNDSVLDMGGIDPGVTFLPGSCVFVEKQNALYLSKMLKRRRRGNETEYFVEYDCDCSEKTSESWVSLSKVYEINPRTRRIFERTSEKRKLNEAREDPRHSKRLKADIMSQQLISMGDIPSGVEFLPGSTLFALTEKGLRLAKMLKKRGRGDNMEYYIQFNGKNLTEVWVSVCHVYEINPQTKRMFNKQQK